MNSSLIPRLYAVISITVVGPMDTRYLYPNAADYYLILMFLLAKAKSVPIQNSHFSCFNFVAGVVGISTLLAWNCRTNSYEAVLTFLVGS